MKFHQDVFYELLCLQGVFILWFFAGVKWPLISTNVNGIYELTKIDQ